jgi:uncharacterized membrane protein
MATMKTPMKVFLALIPIVLIINVAPSYVFKNEYSARGFIAAFVITLIDAVMLIIIIISIIIGVYHLVRRIYMKLTATDRISK